MRKPRVPRDLPDPVIDYFRPQRVILFGSRARSEANRPSGDAFPVPDEDELRRALEIIDALAARLRAANPEPPGR